MAYTFTAKGHRNILATHRSTLEITKDIGLTTKGDCIVAVAADFSLERIQEVTNSCRNGKIKMAIEAAGQKEEIVAEVNIGFSSSHEIVFRTGGFVSERTLGTRADKAAAGLDRKLAERLKGECDIYVSLSSLPRE